MKIAIDISPLESGHKVRGVGFYLERLRKSLISNFPEHKYNFFTQEKPLKESVDLVHYPYFDPFIPSLPFNNKYKTVVTVHDVTPLVFPQQFPAGLRGKLIWQMQKLKLRRIDGIITDSHASKSDIMKHAGISADRISVAYLAAGEEFKKIQLSAARRNELIKKYSLPDKFVLYVGDITWNKNVPRLVESMKLAQLPLVLVGKALTQKDFDKNNVWNKDQVIFHSLIENEKNIYNLGYIPTEDLVAIYNMASVFLFPSLYEGFGLPVIEAMQCGVPVITTREGSLQEVAGDAAVYVDGYDSNSIAEATSHIYHSENLQNSLVAKGILQSKKFSWKQTASDTINIYKKVLQS